MEQENSFIHKMDELAGDTRAVGIDTMLEVILYIKKNNVTEANFIPEAYLGEIFENDVFLNQANIHACTFDLVVNRFVEAKEKELVQVLAAFRQAHRVARQFLVSENTKDKIRKVIRERKSSIEQKAVWNLIIQTIQVIQSFPTNMHARIFSEIMPRLTSTLPSLPAIQDASSAEVGENRSV